jgi:uncharacterized protein (DUF58 family)
MLTSRGSLLVLVVVGILAAALLLPPIPGFSAEGRQTGMILLALTVGLWLTWEWVAFTIRARIVVRRLKVERIVRDEQGPVASLWAGRSFFVDVIVHLPEGLPLSHMVLADRLPFGVELVATVPLHSGLNSGHQAPSGGEVTRSPGMPPRWQGSLEEGQTARWSYRIHCRAAGRVRFEGISLQLADLCGLFYRETFLAAPAEYRVLPPLTDIRGKTAKLKRHNLLPPPGVHRFRRPGSGSELLDLRDYRPGDPPKTIAWKISARRDRLISKDFESEVPVRCTLFVDTSNSVRVGPPGNNTLARLVEIGTNVAQANAGARDLTGLCLFDEKSLTPIRPARGGRHLAHLLNRLTDAAGLAPSTGQASADALLPLAYSFAGEVYPELLRPEVNRMPWWLPWVFPRPVYSRAHPKLLDYLEAGQPFYWLALAAAVAFGLYLLLTQETQVGFFSLLGILVIPCVFLALLGHLFGGHQRVRWRKRMAAVLSVQYHLAPGGLAVLLEDDERFSLYLQRFLADHHIPYSLPLYDDTGRYLFSSPEKVPVLARGLLRAVGRGRDNELFVLLADLLELSHELEPLLRAVKVALARHHQVMVICPWPAGVPWQGPGHGDGQAPEQGRGRLSLDLRFAGPKRTGFLQKLTTERFHRAFRRLQRTFARLGVPVVCARDSEPARLVIERMNRLRPLGWKR